MSHNAAATPGDVMLEVMERERAIARPPGLIIGFAMLSIVPLIVTLAFLRIDRTPGEVAGSHNLERLTWWWAASGLGWLMLTLLGWQLLREQARERVAWSRGAAWCVLLTAILARVAIITVHEPTLSDDLWRYLHDGATLAAGENPYHRSPQQTLDDVSSTSDSIRHRAAERANHPELVTIYLPVSQWVFGATMRLLPEETSLTRAALVLRAVLVGFELIAIGLLLLLLAQAGRNAWWAALYAWHPLALTEIAGSGHQDAIGLPFLVLALVMFKRQIATVGMSGLATAAIVKPFVLPVALLFLRRASWRIRMTSMLIGMGTVVVVTAPFLIRDGGLAIENLSSTAMRFTLKWAHFGPVYELFLSLCGQLVPGWSNDLQERFVRIVCMTLALMMTLIVCLRSRSIQRGSAVMLLGFIILAPVVHPWYAIWPLILLPCVAEPARLTGVWAAWIASLTITFGYSAFTGANDWDIPLWVFLLAYGPVMGTIAVEWWLARHRVLQPIGVHSS